MQPSIVDVKFSPHVGAVLLRSGLRRMVIGLDGERVEFITSRHEFGTRPGTKHKSRRVTLDAWRIWAALAIVLSTGDA